jgi:hypothetical protein
LHRFSAGYLRKTQAPADFFFEWLWKVPSRQTSVKEAYMRSEIRYERMNTCDIWIDKWGWVQGVMIKMGGNSLAHDQKWCAELMFWTACFPSVLQVLIKQYLDPSVCFHVNGHGAIWRCEDDWTLAPLNLFSRWTNEFLEYHPLLK